MSRATFYKYFCEREAILAVLLDRLLGTEDTATPTGTGEPAAEKPAPGRIHTSRCAGWSTVSSTG